MNSFLERIRGKRFQPGFLDLIPAAHDRETDTVYLLDPDGTIPSREEAEEFIQSWRRFYELRDPDELHAHNEDVRQRVLSVKAWPLRPAMVRQPGWVYLLRGPDDLCKIGLTRDIERRRKDFANTLPFEAVMDISVETEDPESLEAQLHCRFEEFRVRGEWFRLSEAQVIEFCDVCATSIGLRGPRG